MGYAQPDEGFGHGRAEEQRILKQLARMGGVQIRIARRFRIWRVAAVARRVEEGGRVDQVGCKAISVPVLEDFYLMGFPPEREVEFLPR